MCLDLEYWQQAHLFLCIIKHYVKDTFIHKL